MMPIYEYRREDGTVFEIVQKVSEEVLKKCPTTGQKVERIMSTFSAHFKGSGFYKTDYKDVSEKERKKKEKDSKVVEGKTVEVKRKKKDE